MMVMHVCAKIDDSTNEAHPASAVCRLCRPDRPMAHFGCFEVCETYRQTQLYPKSWLSSCSPKKRSLPKHTKSTYSVNIFVPGGGVKLKVLDMQIDQHKLDWVGMFFVTQNRWNVPTLQRNYSGAECRTGAAKKETSFSR